MTTNVVYERDKTYKKEYRTYIYTVKHTHIYRVHNLVETEIENDVTKQNWP